MKKIIHFILAFTMLIGASSCSKDVGPAGTQGERGEKGEAGPQGIPGTDGNLILYGNTAPAANLGKVGDFYIDKKNGNLYGPKTTEDWGAAVGMRGATGATGARGEKGDKGDTGAAGSQFLSGTAVPATALGKPGDFYFNTATGQLFGPKNLNNTWAGGISLKGSKGDKGDTGAKGDRGEKGDTGKDGNANVLKYNITVSAADWGGAVHVGGDNIAHVFYIPESMTGGVPIDDPAYVVLAYANINSTDPANDYIHKKQLPFIYSIGRLQEYGIRFELIIKGSTYNSSALHMSKTTNGVNNGGLSMVQRPGNVDFEIVMIKVGVANALKGKVDFNDYRAVAKHFNLKD